eukprot:TRINITY_DN4581_c0_g1_i1.p1 TRINITY_DN4581_c0_g1~~TRINITY_DN4581_c0_g1_i1.p1  ORF type:complete len:339 (+),score=53.96 TRINITY_DN4581_c0_g1_i1:41-1057(+)
MSVTTTLSLFGSYNTQRAFLRIVFGVNENDEQTTTGTGTFEVDGNGRDERLTLAFIARSKQGTAVPAQLKQPLIVFVNDPCEECEDGRTSETAKADIISALNQHLGSFRQLQATDSNGGKGFGQVVLYISIPSNEDHRVMSLEEEKDWARTCLMIDDARVLELPNLEALDLALPSMYKFAAIAQGLYERTLERQSSVESVRTTGPPKLLHAGWIVKQGIKRKNWKRRWLELTTHGFEYYEIPGVKSLVVSPEDEPAPDQDNKQGWLLKRQVPIEAVEVVNRCAMLTKVPVELQRFSFFQVETSEDQDRVFYVGCCNELEAINWVQRFHEAMAALDPSD